jgi:hypothetical protein
MTQLTVLSDIPFVLDFEELLRRLRVASDSADVEQLRRMADHACKIARPKAAYRLAYVDSKEPDGVVVDKVRLSSRVLRVNLEQAHRLVVYVATCGHELHQWSESISDILERYWADEIKATALFCALTASDTHQGEHLELGRTARMNPGSLADWPVTQQGPLFEILGDVQSTIGVKLTDSFLMVPNKSVSGLRFPTATSFENCQLCPREMCPGRRAPYDSELYERKYQRA